MERDFPSNSEKSRQEPSAEQAEPKKIEPVVQAGAIRRRKPLGKRFGEMFGGGDARGVVDYVVLDVLVPAMKDTFTDAITQGVERLIFGESRPSRGRSRTGTSGYTNYTRYSSPPRDEPRSMSRRARASHDFDEIILPTRVEADEVLARMDELIGKYECVSVADLYELAGLSANFMDGKWGWTDLRNAGVERLRGGNGYLLNLPKPEKID